jgi:PhnB protein
MATLTSYLFFRGNCLQAMEFYKSCLGGELTCTKVGDSPAKDFMPAAFFDKLIYAQLKANGITISASDWLRPDKAPIQGNTVCLYLTCGTLQELKIIFEKLSDGADITDPLTEQFFGMYGALNDKFGNRWMFHADIK